MDSGSWWVDSRWSDAPSSYSADNAVALETCKASRDPAPGKAGCRVPRIACGGLIAASNLKTGPTCRRGDRCPRPGSLGVLVDV